MSHTDAVIAAAMRADVDGLRVIAQNIANADSVAYRRQVPVTHTSFDAVSPAGQPHTVLDAITRPATAVDQQPGTFKSTGGPLDVAIEGQGFFVIATDRGEALTRRGDFHVDGQGTLVSASGQPVLGVQGPIQVGMDRISIEADGSVRSGADIVGRLRIVELPADATLQPAGEGVFTLFGEVQPLETDAARVRSGFLETSNVSATGEMIRLMELMRHFETAQRFARGYDEMMSSAINQLGKV